MGALDRSSSSREAWSVSRRFAHVLRELELLAATAEDSELGRERHERLQRWEQVRDEAVVGRRYAEPKHAPSGRARARAQRSDTYLISVAPQVAKLGEEEEGPAK